MSPRQLTLRFDARTWRPDHVEIIADDGEVNAVDLTASTIAFPYESDTFDSIEGTEVIRFVPHALAFMQELYRVAAPGAIASFVLPHGGNDDAFAPNVWSRPYTPASFIYFGQPAYRRADYGYRGDWEVVEAVYAVRKDRFGCVPIDELQRTIDEERNVVVAFSVNLRACKPIRAPGGEVGITAAIAYV